MKRSIVFKDPKQYCSFPSVVCLADGTILVAFRQAGENSVMNSKNGSPTHHDPDSRIRIAISIDLGSSFTLTPFSFQANAPYGVNDPSLSILNDGSLLLRICQVEVLHSHQRKLLKNPLAAHRPDLKTVMAVAAQLFFQSFDGGKTWTDPWPLDCPGFENSASRDSITELEDGTLLQPVYQSLPTKTEEAWLIRSWDKGKTWGDAALMAKDDEGKYSMIQGINYNESSVINIGNGHLIGVVRADSSYYSDGNFMPIGGAGELITLFSENAGFSWSKPFPSGIWGQPAQLLKLKEGVLLCTFGFRKQPYSVKACLSYDNGKNWEVGQTIILAEGAPVYDIGYPGSAILPDGSIISVYYWVDENLTRYIESVVWKAEVKT